MVIVSLAVMATMWTFKSAPLAASPSVGNELSPGVHELRVPDCGGCGWWTTAAPIMPKGGVRFRATVEIAMDDAKSGSQRRSRTAVMR